MRAETLRELLDAEPFHHFTVRTVSGASYLVDHPEVAWLTRGGRTFYVNLPGGAGERVQIIDTSLIERIDPSNAPLPE